MIEFVVDGEPVTQAGTRAVISGGGKTRQISTGGKGLAYWRSRIASEAQEAMEGRPLLTGPLRLEATFTLPRPKSKAKRIHYPEGRPDVSKLVRALEDALSGIVYGDDAQVVTEIVAKRYEGDTGGRDKPGVAVRVSTESDE